MANTQIYNVLPGQPFGRARHGSTTLSSDPHTRRTATGTSGTKSLTLNSGAYSNGDLILIMQVRGLSSASEVNWELNKIVTGGGGTSLTLLNNLARTYSSGCQVIDVKEYLNLTINTFTVSGWSNSANTGGILAFAVLNQLTWAGTPSLKGSNGGSSISDQGGQPSIGGGFRGGANSTDGSSAWRGEGYTGTYGSEGTTRNGNGAGGGSGSAGDNGGGGGGGASAGSAASQGQGGSAVGSTDLTSAVLGGGGGGGRNDGDQNAGGGGNGGGGIFCWANKLTLSSGGVNLNGGTGGSSSGGATSGGGGGGGGFGFFNIAQGTFSTSFSASAGSGRNSGANGGAGRFRVNYGISTSGSTSPAQSSNQDLYLVPPAGGGSLLALM